MLINQSNFYILCLLKFKTIIPNLSDCNWTRNQNHLVCKQTLNHLAMVWVHLDFRFHTCFEQGVPWHSGNYIVWIHSEMGTWHDKNIQYNSNFVFILKHQNCISRVWDKVWKFFFWSETQNFSKTSTERDLEPSQHLRRYSQWH